MQFYKLFPYLFSLANVDNSWITDNRFWHSSVWTWRVQFAAQTMHQPATAVVGDLLQIFLSTQPVLEQPDQFIWWRHPIDYSMKDCYCLIPPCTNMFLIEEDVLVYLRSLWNSKITTVLDDAEEKQITNPAVKQWLDELTHAVFDTVGMGGKSQDGLKVGELKAFPHLQGKLSISKLQNVTDPFEAFQPNLKRKEKVDELSLEWDYGIVIIVGGQWSLPPLGKLLSLSGMKSLKIVGAEFYGSSSSSSSFQPSPSLQILHFEDICQSGRNGT
ncbi:unnamed protein product [Vicia faba]|uniref:Uncharacterized protein n=1 Tax=Vicia faba TaxID=3906 RepID=A0AAV0YFV3_VICFA|nr:unnamed protein product [Vicia faba]